MDKPRERLDRMAAEVEAMPANRRGRIHEAALEIRDTVAFFGLEGRFALTLVFAELAAELGEPGDV